MHGEGHLSRPVRAAPDLALHEYANILWKAARGGLITAAFAQDSVADLLVLPLEIYPATAIVQRSLALALAHDITVYDAGYLALADLVGIPLVTADAALLRKAGGSRIRLLTSFGPATTE